MWSQYELYNLPQIWIHVYMYISLYRCTNYMMPLLISLNGYGHIMFHRNLAYFFNLHQIIQTRRNMTEVGEIWEKRWMNFTYFCSVGQKPQTNRRDIVSLRSEKLQWLFLDFDRNSVLSNYIAQKIRSKFTLFRP